MIAHKDETCYHRHTGTDTDYPDCGRRSNGMADILVIDAQGGGLGKQLITRIRKELPDVHITAVGTNSIATERMLKGGAKTAATGENALIVACRTADVIIGPIGIAMADSLMGEISPAMAHAVSASRGERILIPMNMCDTYVAGVNASSSVIVEDAMEHLRDIIGGKR